MPGETGRPLFDTANTNISFDLPAMLDIGKIPLPEGELGFATVRLGNTTLSVPMDHARAAEWAELLVTLRDMLAPSGKIVAASRPSLLLPGHG